MAVAYALDKSTIKDIEARRQRIRKFAEPLLGTRLAADIQPADFTEVYEAMAKTGASRTSVTHLKWDLSKCWKRLEHDGMLEVGLGAAPSKGIVPKDAKVDSRQRSVLTDPELQEYLDYRHPIAKYDAYVLERQVLCSVSRLFGGLRTGEMLNMRWEAFTI